MYRVGFPGWKIAARLGARLFLRVDVVKDSEAGVYVATSPDLKGMVAEAASLDELFQEVRLGAQELVRAEVHGAPKARPMVAWDGELCPA